MLGDGIKRSGKQMCWGPMCCINPERKKTNKKPHQIISRGKAKNTAEAKKDMLARDLPGGSVVQNPPSKAGDTGSIPGSGS